MASTRNDIITSEKYDYNATQKIEWSRVNLLFNQGHSAFAAIAINSTIYTILSWEIVPLAQLIPWYIFISLSTIFRIYLCKRWDLLNSPSVHTIKLWEKYFLVGLFSSAISWGTIASLFLHAEETRHLILTIFLLAGMTSGATVSCSASFKAIVLFVVTCNSPLITTLLILSSKTYSIMATILCVYIVLMINLGKRLNLQTITSIRLAFKNEELILQLQDEMKERDKNELLKQERDLAEASSRAKSEFLANASHEIRTPVTAIAGFADLLKEQHQNNNEAKKFADIIKRNSEHLLNLTNDLLSLSKNESSLDENSSSNTYFSPTQEINTVAEMFHSDLDKRKIPLFVDYIGPIPKNIHSNPQTFRQILINLIGNAIKYTEHGKIEVSIKTEMYCNSELSPKLYVLVRDTGLGISPETKKELFQPFIRGKSLKIQSQTGAGLGLALSQKLAEKINGNIRLIDSTEGIGSIFEFYLPTGTLENEVFIHVPGIAIAKDFHQDTSLHISNQKLKNIKILIAEDNREIQLLLQTILKNAGAIIFICNNGLEVLEQPDINSFDIIIMDIKMSEMNGYETVERLKNRGASKPILALSAYTSHSDQQQCFQAGFCDFLPKPISQKTLIDTIASHLKFHLRSIKSN